jgi:hypothetical protein
MGWMIYQKQEIFFLLEIVQTGCGAHPASYAVGTTGDMVRV